MMRIKFALLIGLLGLTAACSSDSSPSAPSGGSNGGNGTPVSIVRGAETLTTTAYAPNPINVSPGTTIMWTNNDTTSHTSTADDGSWDSGSIGPGANFSRTFPTAGTFRYKCTIHPNMVGTINVQ